MAREGTFDRQTQQERITGVPALPCSFLLRTGTKTCRTTWGETHTLRKCSLVEYSRMGGPHASCQKSSRWVQCKKKEEKRYSMARERTFDRQAQQERITVVPASARELKRTNCYSIPRNSFQIYLSSNPRPRNGSKMLGVHDYTTLCFSTMVV